MRVKGNNLDSPRRATIAKRNLKKRKGLSEAGRERLRESALTNQPWKYATGPNTPWGKYLSAKNGRYKQKGQTSIREALAEVRADRDLQRFLINHPELGLFDECREILFPLSSYPSPVCHETGAASSQLIKELHDKW